MTELSKVIHVRNVGPEISEVYSHSLVSILGKQRNNADEVIAGLAVFKRPFYLEFLKFVLRILPHMLLQQELKCLRIQSTAAVLIMHLIWFPSNTHRRRFNLVSLPLKVSRVVST